MWRASWQGGTVALLVWSVCRLVPSIPARFQSWMWRLAVLKFAVALVWTVPIELPVLEPPEPATWKSSEEAVSLPASETSAPVAELDVSPIPLLWSALFLGWVAVVAWQAVRMIGAFRESRRLRAACRSSQNRELLARLAISSKLVGLRSPPELLETDGQGSPMLIGMIRPAIVLPVLTLSRLDASEQSMVLGHEVAHVRRGDLFWNFLATIVRTLFFFHPLAWLCERQLRLIQEIAADELAIARQQYSSSSYANLLVSCIGKIGPARLAPTMSVAAAGSQQSLKRRIFAMRFVKPVSSTRVVAYAIVLGTVAMLGLVPWTLVPGQATAADKAEPKAAIVSGKFVSYKDGVLKIKIQNENEKEAKGIELKVSEETKTLSIIKGVEKPGTAKDTFQQWEPGAPISVTVTDGKVTFVQIGAKKASAPDKAVPDKAGPVEVAPKEKAHWGRFASFKDGTLKVVANSGVAFETKIGESTKALVWNDEEKMYKSAVAAEALNRANAETWIVVNASEAATMVRIGAKKGQVVGTFVSFKNGRLLMIGKDLGESYTKKYGNNLPFNKFRDDVPVHESVDGGEYKLIGTANKVLGNVKEGTVLTVHGHGDDNITLIQIGVPKKK